MDRLLLRHLVLGWVGFVELTRRATDEGVELEPDVLAKLDEQVTAMQAVIKTQREMRNGR